MSFAMDHPIRDVLRKDSMHSKRRMKKNVAFKKFERVDEVIEEENVKENVTLPRNNTLDLLEDLQKSADFRQKRITICRLFQNRSSSASNSKKKKNLGISNGSRPKRRNKSWLRGVWTLSRHQPTTTKQPFLLCAYYRQGVALQHMGRHADSLAAFSSSLAQDPKSLQLLAGLVEAAMKSPLRTTLEPTYRQLQTMRLDKSPFVIISVIGQELLAAGHYSAAVVVLEAALKIGTCSLKLRGSVFSALSSAYWALNSLDKAVSYMQQDLSVAKSLGDIAGECRAHGNLGSAYFSKGNFKEALTSHRYQLVLAMKCKDTQAAASALTSLGHVYTAIGDFPNALASHKQCVQLVKQMGDKLQEAREIGNVGAVYLAMGDFDSAVDCHMEHLRIAKQLSNKVEEARAYSNLGSSHHYKRNFDQAIAFHNHVLRIAQELGDRTIEARAYAGLGHAARCLGDYTQAQKWHEKQLDMALTTKDKVAEGRACSNLGIVYQLMGNHDAALKLHQAHLSIARLQQDRAGMGRAYGNIGNAYSAMGYYEQAIKYHKQELTISKEVNDRMSEASTHGNLAVAYQALGMHEMALLHYHSHLNIARELKDTAGEACALLNLGNCHSSRGEFAQAVQYYEQYLMLSQELHDTEGEAKACHFLGYAHYCLGNFKEAIRYYDQDLALAKDLQDRKSMGRAYCNLGLAHLALGNSETALECQKYFLALAHMMKYLQGKFRALGNIGDVLMKMRSYEEAVKVYQKQLVLAKQSRDKVLEASAYGALGLAHRLLKCFDKALGYHTQELTIRQEMGDIKGECKAHGHLGAVHMSLANYTNAMKCYEEQLERAKELKDAAMEAQAFGNLGIARLNMGHYEDAIGYLEQQLATLEQLSSATAIIDKGRALGNLGDCYDALGDYDEAIKCHEQSLTIGLKTKSSRDQERAYRGLGNSHRCVGNLQQSLVCYEKRLVVSHELNTATAKASAYGELGNIHSLLGNYEQAISCMDHQLKIARELLDKQAEAEAACGLGSVYQQMGEYSSALQYHQLDLSIAEEIMNPAVQGRAHGNISLAFESLGNFEEAVRHGEQHLSIAAQMNDKVGKTLAYSSLGRVHHALGNTTQAVAYLQQGLQIAEQLGRREDEAKVRHRLGMALWSHGDLEAAQTQLERAASLLETIRREARGSQEYRLSLFDLQTASYQALQRVLVGLARHYDALLVAERGRTRAFVDLLLERQGTTSSSRANRIEDSTPSSVDQIVDVVNKQKATVLYYSIAAGYLYSWLIVPNKGIVKFHEVNVSELDAERESDCGGAGGGEAAAASGSLLEHYIQSVRDALGVEYGTGAGGRAGVGGGGASETESEAGEMWNAHLEELGDKLNHEADRTGFLRMVNRNHLFNSSNYSLSSLFSLGSVSGSIASGTASRPGSTRSRRVMWQGPSCLRSLYELLIAPMEEYLPNPSVSRELLLVLEGDLYLVPFPVLKGAQSNDYLCEKYSLLVVPSISTLKVSQRAKNNKPNGEQTNALVIGNPKLPSAVTEQWGWGDIPYAEQESSIVAEMLQTKALNGVNASKDSILRLISQMECIHLATHVSWKLSAIILSPGEFVESRASKRLSHSSQPEAIHEHIDDEGSEIASTIDLPALSEFLLTAADILNLKLRAKLVVVSSCHTRDHHGRANSDGVVGLTRALLAAGAQCVLVSLWPVPDTAVKILFRTFYSSLLQGARVSRALSEAQQTVQTTKHFAHPANWAGFLLVGADVKLSNKVALMGQALSELLRTPDKCRDALRVTLHLVEKSLQRIHRGHRNAMYTTQRSIENKVGAVSGWKDLLMSVGFRFEPAANGIPSSVFFPQSDPGERLTQCSASLQALLGLSSTSLLAVSKLMVSPDCAEEVVSVMRSIMEQFTAKELEAEPIEVSVPVKLWRVNGCHELLASLGLDLVDVGREEVTLRTSKLSNKRNIQFAHQVMLALFDTQDTPKSLSMEVNNSFESITSSEDEDEDASSTAPPPPTAPMYPPRSAPLLLGRGAFSSYVRNRGEPDGARASTTEQKGRESDAAFTPSPVDPATRYARTFKSSQGGPPSDQSSPQPSPRISLTLAHQNKIRSLYTSTSPASDGGAKRPDSSSSTSSMTDWESGQSTVRRQPMPKPVPAAKPPTISTSHRVSDVSAGFSRPSRIAINKSNSQASSGFESQSSDSDFGPKRAGTVRSVYTTVGNAATLKLSKGSNMNTLDRLSVRTELGKKPSQSCRRRDISGDRELSLNEKDCPPSTSTSNPVPPTIPTEPRQPPPRKTPEIQLDSNIGKLLRPRTNRAATIHENDPMYNYRSNEDMSIKIGHMGHKSIQDHIIATQMSRLNREMPISDVYHERNLGLGLAPPLSKLLMSVTQPIAPSDNGDTESKSASEDSFGNFDKLSLAEDNQLALPPKPDFKPKPPPIPPKRFGPKPWVSAHPHVNNMAISLEGNPNHAHTLSDLSRRDDGDGRSMTDSHYSGYSPSRNGIVKVPEPPGQGRLFFELTNGKAEREGVIGVRADDKMGPTVAGLHTYAAFNPAYEHDETITVGSIGTRVGNTQIAEYMEQVLGEDSDTDHTDSNDAKTKTCKRAPKHNSHWQKPIQHKQNNQPSSSC
ncbi:tetratricopeptide repeat protein 28 isoform X3 [Hyalella azteca]|uniref:Tetratricopeptide repeat protein 28 isoform X3 n=1 Tax=Hyalella azteca TaxID=294128 RepID=A0A8B7PM86_HYAAZ|nr:tetratricopeptide repeat protein 28 isoform X3 [Hyalella azteca]